MWLGTKNQRIEVSFAGPSTTIIIGSICSIAATMLPSSEYEPVLFEIAVIGMLSALANFNPLLEWDGYYMLMNYLEIPGLRSKSLEFIRKRLLSKVLSRKLQFHPGGENILRVWSCRRNMEHHRHTAHTIFLVECDLNLLWAYLVRPLKRDKGCRIYHRMLVILAGTSQ